MVKTFKEIILNTTQLVNTGNEYSVKIFYTDNKKTVSGKLVGIRRIDSDVIEYTIRNKNKVVSGITVNIQDIETESQLRFLLRQYLLREGWKTIGSRDIKI